MITCTQCGKNVPAHDTFCGYCGGFVQPQQPQPPQPPQQQPPYQDPWSAKAPTTLVPTQQSFMTNPLVIGGIGVVLILILVFVPLWAAGYLSFSDTSDTSGTPTPTALGTSVSETAVVTSTLSSVSVTEIEVVMPTAPPAGTAPPAATVPTSPTGEIVPTLTIPPWVTVEPTVSVGLSTGKGAISVFDLKVGDCFDKPAAGEGLSEVTVVACNLPHDNEAYHVVNYDAMLGDPFPGQEAIDRFIEEKCVAAFSPYVGLPYSNSRLSYNAFEPTEASWQAGDREIVCVLSDREGVKLEGSMRGSKR